MVLVLCHADVEARNCLSNRGEGQQQGTTAATAAVAATPQLGGQAVQRDVSPRVMSSRPADVLLIVDNKNSQIYLFVSSMSIKSGK